MIIGSLKKCLAKLLRKSEVAITARYAVGHDCRTSAVSDCTAAERARPSDSRAELCRATAGHAAAASVSTGCNGYDYARPTVEKSSVKFSFPVVSQRLAAIAALEQAT